MRYYSSKHERKLGDNLINNEICYIKFSNSNDFTHFSCNLQPAEMVVNMNVTLNTRENPKKNSRQKS